MPGYESGEKLKAGDDIAGRRHDAAAHEAAPPVVIAFYGRRHGRFQESARLKSLMPGEEVLLFRSHFPA